MNSLDTKRIATLGLLSLLFLTILFHVLVVLRVIPSGIVWGGRLENASQLLAFETISISVNLLMLGMVSVHAGLVKVKMNRLVIRLALWAMAALFLLNTLGNLLSTNEFEKLVFTPLTLLLSLFSFRLALSKEQSPAFASRSES